ncbi:MAG: histidine kinase N-terminal 7TM domain-containing protein, partial [Roseiflexaceae bacterium]|nr:histidine kinase N-terminal 7TM domain-containing protein [Roseiflexaceae bacterium]
MGLLFTFYVSALLILGVVAMAIAAYAWRRREMPGASPLSVLGVSTAIWLIGQSMELTSQTIPAVLWWVRFEFVGIVSLPSAWLWFAAEYTGSIPWLRHRRIWLLAIVPTITMAVLLTNDYHSLFWKSITLRVEDFRIVIDSQYGSWFWVHVAYSYTCLLTGAYVIMRSVLQTASLF